MKDCKVSVHITGTEYKKLKKNLELFNCSADNDDKLTFDEFVSLIYEVTSLEEKLDSKYSYLNALKEEISHLEEQLNSKYQQELTPSKDSGEILKSRKQNHKRFQIQHQWIILN